MTFTWSWWPALGMPCWSWWESLGMPCWSRWPALGIAGVLVFAAACFAGLWLVARVGFKSVQKPRREWREAAEAWTRARDALREARADVKRGATNLAAAKRRLKRMLRELQAAGKPPSTLTPAGDAGDAAREAMVEMEEEARQAVADAGRTLGIAEEEAHRRRGALAERGRDVRARAKDACHDRRSRARERIAEIRRDVAGEKELEQLRVSLRGYFKGVAPRGWKGWKDWKDWKNWKNLLTGYSYWAVVLAHLLTTTALDALGVLPLIACRSTLCARLAAPGRGIHA